MIIYVQVILFLRSIYFVLASSHPRNSTLVSGAVLGLFFDLDYFNAVGCRIYRFEQITLCVY
jgi:cell shape-determining protein MreD